MRATLERIIAGSGTFGLLLVLWSAAAWTPFHDWNGARFYPAYLLSAGEQLYHVAGVGVINGWIYGPGLPLVLAPATLIPNPTWAMVTAAWINIVVLVAPIMVILQMLVARGLPGERRWVFGVLVTAALLLLPTTARRLTFITCDQLAIGLGCTSCFVLYRAVQAAGRRARSLRWLAAVLAVAAVWTKQTEVMIPAAELLFLAMSRGRRTALNFLGELAGLSLLSIVGLSAWAGWDALWFNLAWIPAHHPLATGAQSLGSRFGRGILESLPFVVVAIGGRRRRGAAAPEDRLLTGLYLLAGGALLTTGVLAAAKSGGEENSFHFVYYFALAAITSWAGPVRAWLASPAAGTSRALACAAGVAVAAWLVTREAPLRLRPASSMTRAIALATELRGQVIFPRDPLITWVTEHKQYHLEWGVFDQTLAGVPLRFGQFWDGMPAQLDRVVYPFPGRYFFMQLMPDLRQEVVLPDLAVYTAGPRPPSPFARR